MTARLTIFMGRVSAAVSRAMLALVREPAGALWWPESTPDSLHPCFLGDEADKAIAASRTRPVFVCTHSDPFVLRVRRRIAEGSLAHTDVALVWVEPDGTEKPMALNARAVHEMREDVLQNGEIVMITTCADLLAVIRSNDEQPKSCSALPEL